MPENGLKLDQTEMDNPLGGLPVLELSLEELRTNLKLVSEDQSKEILITS